MRQRMARAALIAVIVLWAGVRGAWLMAGRGNLPPGFQEAMEARNVPAVPDTPLDEIVANHGWHRIPEVNILIDKSELTLAIRSGDETLKTYPVALGCEDRSDKQRRGDRLTPEGEFYICQRNMIPNDRSWQSVWMRLSYPDSEDAEGGLADGIITEEQAQAIKRAVQRRAQPPQDTELGSGIGIHAGGICPRTWTLGCIALQYPHALEVFRHTRLRTPVTIQR